MSQPSTQLVLMDHDGAIDDFLSVMLLMTMETVQPLGIIVTPADCYLHAATRVTRKILDLMGRENIPVVKSNVRGIHPFPPEFRKDCLIIDNFPILNSQNNLKTPLLSQSGTDFMVQTLKNSVEPVTLMITGPLTTLATALDLDPTIETKIEKIVWMGGALNVAGNVEKAFALEQNGTAEWNVYWDAMAAKRVWETKIPIILCPLDITNTVPVTPQLIRQLTQQRQYPLSDLAGLCYALAIPQNYYCWDLLATSYLAQPDLFTLREVTTEIVTTGMSEGQTKIVSQGRKIQALDKVNHQEFYNYILQQFAR
ncbi:MAG: nucleoside hydrolase [Microcystaceae cyanobacterium]